MNNHLNSDLLIYSVGYESRASYVLNHIKAEEFIALAFEETTLFSYQKNLKLSKEQKHQILYGSEVLEDNLFKKVTDFFVKNYDSNSDIVISLDVSCMTRHYMSVAILALRRIFEDYDFTLRILYTPGLYKSPDHSETYVDFRPVEEFQGWTLYPERPLSVILGLGYEPEQAAGVVEFFDPSGTWAFIPLGDDDRYLGDITQSNKSLEIFLKNNQPLYYTLDEPKLLYAELRGLADLLSKQSRVIIIPGGPKIFSAISMLVCLELGDELSLWRASSGSSSPEDTMPADKIISFDYRFKKRANRGEL